MRNTRWVLSALLMLGLCAVAQGWAQDAGGGGGAGAGGGADRFAAFRQARMDALKKDLGVTDDEWKVLQPKIDAVDTLSRQTRVSGGGMFGFRPGMGRGGMGGGQPATPGGATPPAAGTATGAAATPPTQTDLEKKTQALRTYLENKDADPKGIVPLLKDVRDAREAAKAALKKAQDELRELLSPKQEATLVLRGTLD